MEPKELIDTTDKCIIGWVEDGVLGCTYNHKDNELCLDMICEDCRLYKCTCYEDPLVDKIPEGVGKSLTKTPIVKSKHKP